MDQNPEPLKTGYLINCPEDILRLVFEAIINTRHDPRISLKQSNRLAAVCRTWRIAALTSPRLWSTIYLRMGPSSRGFEDYWTRTIERVRKVPVTVRVSNMCSEWRRDLSKMIHEASFTIYSLHLEFEHYGDLGRLIDIWGRFPVEIENLTISLQNPEEQAALSTPSLAELPDVHGVFRWEHIANSINCELLTNAFHCHRRLSIIGWDRAFLSTSYMESALCVQLHLTLIESLDLGDLFSCFPLLEYLSLSDCSLMRPSTTVPVPSLRSLHIFRVKNVEWAMETAFPNLECLSYNAWSLPPLHRFLERHQKITNLSINGNVEYLLFDERFSSDQMFALASQVVSLALGAEWAYRLIESCMFPSLKSLTVVHDTFINPERFYPLLKARFLPLSHPQSIANDPSRVVDELFIEVDENHLRQSQFIEGDLYNQADKEVERVQDHGRLRIRLSWPMRPSIPHQGMAQIIDEARKQGSMASK